MQMTFRTTLLAAAAAIALPAALAAAQAPAPTTPTPPLGGAVNPGTQANVPVAPTAAPPVADTASPTTLQTEEAIEAAADAVEADATADAQAQAQAQAPPPAATPAPAPAAQPAAAAQAQAQAPVAAQAGPVRLATAADLRAGIQVRDQSGALVGTVESADAAGAVVTTGTARARLPLSSFGSSSQGLVIAMNKAQFEAAVAAANTPS
jgi:hypothetical protein